MIYYNMRYRGAYEYDKFALNILQYSNDANMLLNELEGNEEYQNIKEIHNTINELYDKYTSLLGIGEKVYRSVIMFKER